MALFYFDFCQRTEISKDNRGLNFSDTESAYLAAYEAAIQMWGDLLRERKDPRRCAFRVRDAEGTILFHFHFQEALDCCHQNGPPCSSMAGTRRKSLQLSQQGHQLCADFQHELNKATETLKESKRLIDVSLPCKR